MRTWNGSIVLAVLVLVLAVGFVVLVPEGVRADPGIDSIRIVDAPDGFGSWVSGRNYTFGDNDTFWAAGYNDSSGWVQDVSVYWLFTQSGTAVGNKVVRLNYSYGTSVKVFTNGYGMATLHALGRGIVANMTNDTGPLWVDVGNVDSVVVRSEQGGAGTWVGDTTYQTGDEDKFYPAAYDSAGNFLGDIVANWSSTNLSVGYIYSSSGRNSACDGSGSSVSCYPLIRFHASAIGHTYVNATPVATSLTNVTGKLTVNGTGIDHVLIRNGPNDSGDILGNGTYYEREQDTFYAASYNDTYGYRGDVVGDWTSSNGTVCQVKGYTGGAAHGSSVQVLMKTPGICTVTVNATTVSGPVTNTTGNLTVLRRTTLTVDANGGKDYTRIQDAVDNASDGFTIEVYPAVYFEHVVVDKELEIVGTDRDGVVIDGSNRDTALYLGADHAVVHQLTIRNTTVGLFNDRTNNTRLYNTTIRDYVTGVNNSHTLNAWVAYNQIVHGGIGVVAYEAYDDAIRWNEIAFNTKYGGKGYDAHLRNCFNWNYLHDNHIGYYYDPTTELPPMEFDGNTVWDNDIGVKVENSSAIRLTKNAISGGSEGVQLLHSSSEVRSNSIDGVAVGVRFLASDSNITGNAIAARQVGILGDGGAPRIEGNHIVVTSSGVAMSLKNLDGAVISGNDIHGGWMSIQGSRVATLAPVNSVVLLEDSTVESLALDASSRVEVRWTVRVVAVAAEGGELGGCSVTVRDGQGTVVYRGATGSDGTTPPFLVTTQILTSGSVEDRNPFTFEVSLGSRRAVVTMAVTGAGEIAVTVPESTAGMPLWLVAGLVVALFASACLAAAFAVERSRYALLVPLLPLYSRIARDDPLKNLNRGRVYEYIELNPGTHFNAILAALDMNNGTLVYHLEVLQKDGFVTSRQEGMYRRFYPRGTTPPPLLENGTTEAEARVLKAIQEMPGITQRELALFLGLRQSTLAYQIDKLAAKGYIASEKRGRKVHYTARQSGT